MDLRQLRYFTAIVEAGSFRAAGDELRIAQPALSQQIRRLEDELGVRLFDRSTRPVGLTPAGEHLLPRARRILIDVDQTAAEVRDFAGEYRGRITVGAMQYLTNLELPDLFAAFRERHPLVELGLRVGNTGQLCEMLERSEIDVALCHSDELVVHPHLETRALRTEELVVVVPPDHPRAGHAGITAEDLAETPLITFRKGASIRDALERAFARTGLTPRISFESADMPTAIQLAHRGLGVTLIPRSIASRDVDPACALPFLPEALRRQVALVWRHDRHRSRALRAFCDQASEALGGPRTA